MIFIDYRFYKNIFKILNIKIANKNRKSEKERKD